MPKILLVEDDPMISDIYQRKFSSGGFEVVTAASGKEVLEKALHQSFDLILLDLLLPEMNGMEVLEHLRKDDGYSPDLKIVIFSNLSEYEDRNKAVELGANGFIPKTDYTPSQLVDEVRRFLYQAEERKKNLERKNASGQILSDAPRKSILLIEDEEVFAEMFGGRLEQSGYEVVHAANGSAGLAMALERHFDLIITDMVMPGMTGQEVINALRIREDKKDIPIFVFSASLVEDDLERMRCEGAEKCFMKTRITPSDLASEVDKLLKPEA